MGKDSDIYIAKEYIKVNKNIKRCSKLIVVRKLQIKTIVSHHSVSTIIAKPEDQRYRSYYYRAVVAWSEESVVRLGYRETAKNFLE